MKKLSQLFILEPGKHEDSLLSRFLFLHDFANESAELVHTVADIEKRVKNQLPHLVLLYSNLTSIQHLQQFVQLYAALPYSSIIIVSDEQDEEICLLALEAGAVDSIRKDDLTPAFMRKAVLLSLRWNRTEKEKSQNREQLLACIQNTPNLAVQWYNSKGEVLFWNQTSERIFGWKAEEAISKTIDELIVVPENRGFWLHKIQHLATTNATSETEEWTFRCRDGSEGCCISTLISIPSFDSEPLFVCLDVDITRRKQIEKALQESEDRYHTIFNDASDAIFINDTNGRFLDVNGQGCELLHYTKEQLLQMRVEELFSNEELVRRPIMRSELMAGQRTAVERMMKTASGGEVPVEITAQKLKDGRIMAIVRNIAERKQTEEALVKSEAKYRSLVEQQGDAITIFNDKGCILDVNTSATQLLHYSREEFQKMTMFDVIAGEDSKINPISFDLLNEGVATIKQRIMRRKDGNLVDTEVHAKRLGDGQFLASIRDLTERIEVQHQLEKEKELSDSIINSLPGLFYLFTKEGRYVRWNRLLEIISGYPAQEISKMNPLNLIAEENRNTVQVAINRTFNDGEAAIEADLLTREGKKIPFYF
ncbi:MAG TPA: PAS domain S-box protein, partial [Flavisolibacter sp.]|nr:PAS domain S-box protein [Flavisolibacter sp.]